MSFFFKDSLQKKILPAYPLTELNSKQLIVVQNIVLLLDSLEIKIYSTGGTQRFIEDLKIKCIPVESLTTAI